MPRKQKCEICKDPDGDWLYFGIWYCKDCIVKRMVDDEFPPNKMGANEYWSKIRKEERKDKLKSFRRLANSIDKGVKKREKEETL